MAASYPSYVFLCPACSNSELYNHEELKAAKLAGVDLHSKSDSAVVGYLYQKCVKGSSRVCRTRVAWWPHGANGGCSGIMAFATSGLLSLGACWGWAHAGRLSELSPWLPPPACLPACQPPSMCHNILCCRRYGDSNELWNSLDGIFACVIWDERTGHFTAARDPIGICSLYWGRGEDGSVWFASEMKALQDHCKTIDFFPPVRRARGVGGALGRSAAARRRPYAAVAGLLLQQRWCRRQQQQQQDGACRCSRLAPACSTALRQAQSSRRATE